MGRMEVVKLETQGQSTPVELRKIPRDITDWEKEQFAAVTSSVLTPEQKARVLTPSQVFPRQHSVLAVHWHPEFIPMDMIMARIRAMYPNMNNSLIIPTQHNTLLTLDKYAGVEVDCYSHGFNRKVQLLLHFTKENLDKTPEKTGVLKAMLAHTFKYRSSQLFDFLDSLAEDAFEERRQKAAAETGADGDLVEFCRIYARKLNTLLAGGFDAIAEDMIKNKLVNNFFDVLRGKYGDRFISRVQVYLRAVKMRVKERFSLKYFYRASEVIEEARMIGAGVVIPHPEQFWPILLADYDVDGYEVWNPQSRDYTEFLIKAVERQNKSRCRMSRPLLVFMGDDCHMSEKIKEPGLRDKDKGDREIGLQPAWEDLSIRKSLIVSGLSCEKVIEEYKHRLE